jgi:hypothetical protein
VRSELAYHDALLFAESIHRTCDVVDGPIYSSSSRSHGGRTSRRGVARTPVVTGDQGRAEGRAARSTEQAPHLQGAQLLAQVHVPTILSVC